MSSTHEKKNIPTVPPFMDDERDMARLLLNQEKALRIQRESIDDKRYRIISGKGIGIDLMDSLLEQSNALLLQIGAIDDLRLKIMSNHASKEKKKSKRKKKKK